MADTSSAADHAGRGLPEGAREQLQDGLAGAELRSLLLAVAARRAARVKPSEVLAQWRADRFVRPAAADPRQLNRVEGRLWELLPGTFAGVELSPVAPLGTCTAVAPVSQNRVVTTVRLTEVVSDSTNVLAIEAAKRRLEQSKGERVHVAASHRQLRAQRFGPDAAAHFRLFTLVSAARDTGSARTEARLLSDHLTFWREVLEVLVPERRPQIEVTLLDDPALAERVAELIGSDPFGARVPILLDPGRSQGRGYYTSLALRISVEGGTVELGDGGFTDWVGQLTGNRKERCLVSCIAPEHLAELMSSA